MVKKQVLIFLSLIFSMGCGSSGGPEELLDPVQETALSIGVVGGKEGINVIPGTNSTGQPTIRYLGQIENKGLRPFCFLDISFSTKDVNGTLIDQGPAQAQINGYTLTLVDESNPADDQENNSCLEPGQTGSFDTRKPTGEDINLLAPFSNNFDFRLCFKNNIERCVSFASNRAIEPRAPLELLILSIGPDNNGMRTVQFRVRNNATDLTAIPYDIKVHYTVINNQGKVIDTVITQDPQTKEPISLTAQPCGDFNIFSENPLGCLTSGAETQDFTLQTSVLDSEVCASCSYFRIYRKECVLKNGSCPDS